MADPLGEFDLIARYLEPLATSPGAFHLKDDAALIPVPVGKKLVMSKDVLIGGVHFFADDLPDLIARKALRTNVSDIIAKGADPAYYALGLCFAHNADGVFWEAFAQGLEADQDVFGLSLLGGDTTRSLNDFVISVTMFGLVDEKGPITRFGAQAHEAIYVSGHLGNSALGLLSLQEPDRFVGFGEGIISDLQGSYLLPQPPYGLQSIIARYASASMDISDGILADLAHLGRASHISAHIEQEDLPLSGALKMVLEKYPDLIERAIQGGDDYQCLMTVPAHAEGAFVEACARAGQTVTRIGYTDHKSDEPVYLYERGAPSSVKVRGYTHF